jgi:hypothetical protein
MTSVDPVFAALIDRSQSAEAQVQHGDTMESTRDGPKSTTRPPLSRPFPHQSDAHGAKRRSLLPQPGHTRHTSLLSGTTTARPGARTEDAAFERTQPKSIRHTLAVSQEVRTKSMTTAVQSLRPCPEPQTAKLARSGSLRIPGLPLKHGPSIGIVSHSRVQSAGNVAVLPTEVAIAKTANERPRSLLVAPYSTSKSNNDPVNSGSTAPRTSARLAGMNRTASVKLSAEKSNGSGGTRSAVRPGDPVAMQPRRREITNEEATRTARPAFTTLQQHFTPRKIGKPPTSLFLHPTLPADSSSLSSEVVSLQSELLQLYLLHRSSAQMERRWQVSAKRSLQMTFEEVVGLHQTMLKHEQAGQEQKNLQAFIEWSNQSSSTSLNEKTQLLSGSLHELPALVEPGGRFQRLVGEYERWMVRVESMRSARVSMSNNRSDLGPVEGLGDLWKVENAALIRKITSLAHDLGHLDQTSPGSSINCVVETCSALLQAFSDELQTMQSIEADVVSKEKDYVEACLQAIALDVGFCLDTTWETAMWRT